MPSFDALLRLYDYSFPRALVAQRPVHPRDAARLLVYNPRTTCITEDVFRNIGNHLPHHAVLVLNRTKVIPARLVVTKCTGGKVRVLLVHRTPTSIAILADRALRIGDVLSLGRSASFVVHARQQRLWILRPQFPMARLRSVLQRHGKTPLPPYIKQDTLPECVLRREYQSVFAREEGSVAAPTASLHFTKTLLRTLQRQGVTLAEVVLHVNLGTFAPLTEEQVHGKKLHAEEFFIPAATAKLLARAQKEGRPIIAVGTTAVRTLESACDARGRIVRRKGATTLFIREGYRFRLVQGLITNFHVPKSSLLMLVAALVGRKEILRLYHCAIRRKFRLFSFGDGMFVQPNAMPQAARE